jgi:hypothetical protein
MFDSQIANDIVEKNTDPRIQPSTEKRYIMHIHNIVNGDLDLIIWLLRYGDRVAQYDDHFKCGNEI